ncbi:hypothetical protein ACF3OF_03055 [Sneathia vaginalis]|uniref:hypothetical protein n=1 Tax=Sneathia vaginalis TaxID=187101 RepID=UPI00370D5078
MIKIVLRILIIAHLKKSIENVDYIDYTYSIEVAKNLYYIFTFKVLKEENNRNELEIISRVILVNIECLLL